jgi:2-aminoadipate transaminase
MTLSHSTFPFSRRVSGTAPSAVREILKVAEQPDVLSFAGGLPAPELFPADAIAEASARVLGSDEARAGLQYGVTEGHGPLREWVAARFTRSGVPTKPDDILITHGSQQGIDLVARAFLDPGDRVIVEDPTYLAALQAFSACEAVPVAVPSDDDGLRTNDLDGASPDKLPSLLYVVPTFQNPSGRSLTENRRRELVRWAARRGVPVLADEPYADIRFAGEPLPALASFDDDLVIQLGTFSKTLAPGLRIGWLRAAEPIRKRLVTLKQASDLHTSTLNQRIVAKLLESFDFEGHLERVRSTYRVRHAVMHAALLRSMPNGTSWTKPEGGLFVWMTLPAGVTDLEVFEKAIARKVAVVPGSPFFVSPPARGHIRLSFGNRSEALIERGMATLGEVVTELARAAHPRPSALRSAPPSSAALR